MGQPRKRSNPSGSGGKNHQHLSLPGGDRRTNAQATQCARPISMDAARRHLRCPFSCRSRLAFYVSFHLSGRTGLSGELRFKPNDSIKSRSSRPPRVSLHKNLQLKGKVLLRPTTLHGHGPADAPARAHRSQDTPRDGGFRTRDAADRTRIFVRHPIRRVYNDRIGTARPSTCFHSTRLC